MWSCIKTVGLCALLLSSSCGGTKNVADCAAGGRGGLCSPETPDEQAQSKLNAGDFTGAIDQLNELLAAEPEGYQRLPLLASGYAARAGLEILNVAKAQYSAGSSLLEVFSSFIPTPKTVGPVAYEQNVADMQAAVTTLKRIPAALLATATAASYSASAILQLTLYQAAYAVMFLNQFAISPTTGQLDQGQLSQLSAADAEQILANLAAIGQTPALSTNAAVQTQVATTLAKINAEPGSTSKDKITAYVAAQKSGSAKTFDGRQLTKRPRPKSRRQRRPTACRAGPRSS